MNNFFQKVLNSSEVVNKGNWTADTYEKFFSQLPRKFIERLYDYYKLDFQMFGFEVPTKYIEMGYTDVVADRGEINKNKVEVNDENPGM